MVTGEGTLLAIEQLWVMKFPHILCVLSAPALSAPD